MILPVLINWDRWAAETGSLLYPYGFVAQRVPEERWQDFARGAVALPALSALGVPRPEGFTDWNSWAARFNGALALLGL